MKLKQCDTLKAKITFSFTHPETRRKRTIKQGDKFWVTTTENHFLQNNIVGVAKEGQNMASAVFFTPEMIADLFE